MKTSIAAFGDIHLRANPPEMRIDDYLGEQEKKLKYTFRRIPENSLVAFPGDIFNSSKEPYWLIEMFMNILNKRKDLHYLFVPGQHDQRFHNLDLHNTPIRLLHAGVKNSTILDVRGSLIRDFLIYGRHYEAPIPKPCENAKNKQILLAHKMLIKDEDLYPGQEAVLAKSFMRIYPYDIIISGDNHMRFTETYKDRILVNMGSFMRMKTDQKKHQPAIAIIDDLKINFIEIPVKSANEVFAKKESKVKELVQTIGKDFIHGIKEDERKGVTFIDRLNKKLRKEDEDVRNVIADCLQQIGE